MSKKVYTFKENLLYGGTLFLASSIGIAFFLLVLPLVRLMGKLIFQRLCFIPVRTTESIDVIAPSEDMLFACAVLWEMPFVYIHL